MLRPLWETFRSPLTLGIDIDENVNDNQKIPSAYLQEISTQKKYSQEHQLKHFKEKARVIIGSFKESLNTERADAQVKTTLGRGKIIEGQKFKGNLKQLDVVK